MFGDFGVETALYDTPSCVKFSAVPFFVYCWLSGFAY